MPIYAYKCASCGYAKDALQKISDAPLTVCPQCGQPTFQKQVTAAGFQLKGTGWYVTDFRNGSGGASTGSPHTEADESGKAESASASAGAEGGEAAKAKPESKPEGKAQSKEASRPESAGGGASPSAAPPASPSPSSSSSSSGGAASGD